MKKYIFTATNAWKQWNAEVPIIFLGTAPLFLVTLRFWSGAILILGAFFCLAALLFNKARSTRDEPDFKILILLALMAPVLMTALSSAARGRYVISEYDSASRFMVAAAIFTWGMRQKINIARILVYSIPLSLLLTLLHQVFIPQPYLWGEARMSTYFSDPLVFGYTSLALGLMSLVSINLFKKDTTAILAFKLTAAAIGFYLSIKSGSRTGWLAVPVVMLIWLHHDGNLSLEGLRRNGWVLFIIVCFALATLFLSDTVSQRISMAFREISEYPWTGIAPETSVGFRITFLRIAKDMFMSSPLVGFGDTRYESIVMPTHIYSYASPESIRVALTAGFHNEMVTSAIHFGLPGVFATSLLFFAPLWIFWRQLRSTNTNQRANALLGLVFVIVFIVSSCSTEVFDLKYVASFYALMIATLSASCLSARADDAH